MARTKRQSGPCSDCALTFENGPAEFEHASQTGHMKSRTCVTCRRVFVNKQALKKHKKSSPKHKPAQEDQAPTTTTTPNNGQKNTTTKAKATAKPASTETVSTSQGVKMTKKDGDRARSKAAAQGQVVNVPSQSATADQEANHPSGMPSEPPLSRRARKRLNQANSAGTVKNDPISTTTASKNTAGTASVPTKAAMASSSSALDRNSLSKSNVEGTFMPPLIGSFILEKDIAHLKPKSNGKEQPPMPPLIGAFFLGSDMAGLKRSFSTRAPESPESPKQGRAISKAPRQAASNPTPAKAAMASGSSGSRSQQQLGQSSPFSSWVSPPQNPATFAALQKLCHGTKRLRGECFITPGPLNNSTTTSRYIMAPPREWPSPKRLAVVLDCEMVEVVSHRSEVARLCAADMITGEILIDALVEPTERVRDWRTRYSGVSASSMAAATASGSSLRGWPAARARLFEHVNRETILCGHALQNDLRALGIAHARVVDSALVTAQAAFARPGAKLKRRWKLKTLARELLGLGIQDSPQGHDCVEDTLATREVLLWCATRPRELAAWGVDAGAKFERENNERIEKQRLLAKEQREKKEREEAAAAAAAGLDKAPRVLGEDFDWDRQDDGMTWDDILRADEPPEGYILYGQM